MPMCFRFDLSSDSLLAFGRMSYAIIEFDEELSMHRLLSFFAIAAQLFAVIGCGSADSGPFGPPKESLLLKPFAGEWTCDFEKTLDAQKAAGATDEDIARVRKFVANNPLSNTMHPDIQVTGDVALFVGLLSSEYRFYSMHQHGNKVCGKAWFHEDRSDPGDMSKCYVRLMIHEDCLHFYVKMSEGSADVNDPDLQTMPAVEGGSVSKCDADKPAEGEWSPWMTYVFSKKMIP